MKTKAVLALLLFFLACLGGWWIKTAKNSEPVEREGPAVRNPVVELSQGRAGPAVEVQAKPKTNDLTSLKKNILAQLDKTSASHRSIEIPPPLPLEADETPSPSPLPPTPRSIGRKEREILPMGVVLWDGAAVYASSAGGKKIYEMQTGDFVRVYSSENGRVRIHPGLDIFLAATTKRTEPAGERLPDTDGWLDSSKIHIFTPEQAQEFLLELTPITLGEDPSFSTLAFYERAMKNPDPVVHRVIGPRLISVVTLHADYASSWFALYRDRNPKVRTATLAFLRERGIANSRPVIEDLIQRLIELTPVRARGETEVEALAVLDILQQTHHPRVPAALTSFSETWKQTQGAALNETLWEILSGGEKPSLRTK